MKFCPTCGHVRVPSPSMTTRERDCMLVIQELSAGGVSPSYEMIARELDMKSRSGVSPLIESLERRGYLRREAGPTGARRAITILRRIPVPRDQIDLEEAIAREHAA